MKVDVKITVGVGEGVSVAVDVLAGGSVGVLVGGTAVV